MYTTNIFKNPNIEITNTKGPFSILEYKKDLSNDKNSAIYEYFAEKMNVKKRQLLCNLEESSVNTQAGAMQYMLGDVEVTTGIKSAGDFLSKTFRGAVTNESAVKPEYRGDGIVVLEPTYKHILLIDTSMFRNSLVIEDGLYLASESHLKQKTVARKNLSSAALGNEGIFNLGFEGSGLVVVESPCPEKELLIVDLDDDILKIDGSYAIAWSNSLKFTVQRSSKSLIGSAASGEGLVNVYEGSGKILVRPV